MEFKPEESLRFLLQQNYALLEQYSRELELSPVEAERVEELLGQVKSLAVVSLQELLALIPRHIDPQQSEYLESSVNYLHYALGETRSSLACRHTLLRRVLYHSQMALLSSWFGGYLLLPDFII